MALPREYLGENCPVARSLEVVGERWTLLIIRDAFYGVRRFSDFRDHLNIPRAVLSERLNLLVEHEILARTQGTTGRDEYTLTAKGEQLWPTLWALISWGNEHYVPKSRRRPPFTHDGCGGRVAADGRCESCGATPLPRELTLQPRAQHSLPARHDPVSQALSRPHHLLAPIAPPAR